jgi:hypothetical protein
MREPVTIDGVEVYAKAQGEGSLTATLTFGYGGEVLDTLGLNHVVLEVALATARHVAAESDHLEGGDEVSITATGTPEQVAEHLRLFCLAVNEVPPADTDELDEILFEIDPWLRSDLLNGPGDPAASLLARRFGPHGPGLGRWPAINYEQVTAEQIAAFAAARFTAGNAILELDGPIPPGLSLPLRPGPRYVHTAPVSRTQGSAWYADEVNGPAISFTARLGLLDDEAFLIVSHAIAASAEREGLKAVMDRHNVLLDSGRQELIILLEPGSGQHLDTALAAGLMLREVRRLATEGPAGDELTGPDSGHIWGYEFASRRFTGAPPEPQPLPPATTESVRSVIAGWLESALIVVPHGDWPDLPGFAEGGCRSGAGAGGHEPRVEVDSSTVSYVDRFGARHTSSLTDVLLVQDSRGEYLGDAAHGCLIDISAFEAGQRAALKSALPPHRLRLAHYSPRFPLPRMGGGG